MPLVSDINTLNISDMEHRTISNYNSNNTDKLASIATTNPFIQSIYLSHELSSTSTIDTMASDKSDIDSSSSGNHQHQLCAPLAARHDNNPPTWINEHDDNEDSYSISSKLWLAPLIDTAPVTTGYSTDNTSNHLSDTRRQQLPPQPPQLCHVHTPARM
ncbi:hypothetical protein BDF22DRAFT_744018 [Syncephalis plumigaleata]|nr:hypothetical protein BDF22DRAFT_744018 [Syncephalis plumigaleata]